MHQYNNIAHIGVGNFFRAHQAAYINRVNQHQVKLLETQPQYQPTFYNIHAFEFHNLLLAQDLNSQNGNYTLATLDNNNSTSEVITSIAHVYTKSDLIQFINVIADPQTNMITLTVTERGYEYNNDVFKQFTLENNVYNLDLDYVDCKSIYSVLYYGLKCRFMKYNQDSLLHTTSQNTSSESGPSGPEIDIVSCDNIVENTHILKKRFLEFVKSDKEFVSDLSKYGFFRISIVDRITPVTTLELRNQYKDCKCPVQAEHYTTWYIESLPKDKDQYKDQYNNVQNILFEKLQEQNVVFTSDVENLTMTKIRILNGGHMCLSHYAKLKGYSTVFEAMQDADVYSHVKDYMDQTAMVLKTLIKSNFNYDQYITNTLNRFLNRHIVDYIDRLLVDTPNKLEAQILPLIKQYNLAQCNLDVLYKIHANYIICLNGQAISGQKFDRFEKNDVVYERGLKLYQKVKHEIDSKINLDYEFELVTKEECKYFLTVLYSNEVDKEFLHNFSTGVLKTLKELIIKYNIINEDSARSKRANL